MLNVKVSTLVFGRSEAEQPLPEVRLRLVSQRITAHDLIAQAVQEQLAQLLKSKVDHVQIRKKMAAQYLDAADIKAQQDSGKIALEKPDQAEGPSLEYEIDRALKAFRQGRFKLFVDGSEVRNPNDEVTLSEGALVKFVRLIPLVGG